MLDLPAHRGIFMSFESTSSTHASRCMRKLTASAGWFAARMIGQGTTTEQGDEMPVQSRTPSLMSRYQHPCGHERTVFSPMYSALKIYIPYSYEFVIEESFINRKQFQNRTTTTELYATSRMPRSNSEPGVACSRPGYLAVTVWK